MVEFLELQEGGYFLTQSGERLQLQDAKIPTYAVSAAFADPIPPEDILRISYSRSLATIYNGFQAGRGKIVLSNHEGNYSPDNAAGSYSGALTVNQSIQVTATFSGVTYKLFSGFIDSFAIDPLLGKKTSIIQMTDLSKEFFSRIVRPRIYENVPVSSLVTDVLSLAGVPASLREVDEILDMIPHAIFDSNTAVGVLTEINNYGDYGFFVDPSGDVRFKNRNTKGRTVVASFTKFFQMNYSLSDATVFNKVSISGIGRKKLTTPGDVAIMEDTKSITASGTIEFWLTYTDPETNQPTAVYSMSPLVNSVNYLLNSQADGGGTDLTATASASVDVFTQSAKCTVFNGGGTAGHLILFKLTGFALQQRPDFTTEFDQTSSQALYGEQSFSLTSPMIADPNYSQNYAEYIATDKGTPSGVVKFAVKNVFPTTIMSLDVGDAIHISEEVTGVGSTWAINKVSHDVSFSNGVQHKVDYDVEFKWDRLYWILDDPITSVIDGDRVLTF